MGRAMGDKNNSAAGGLEQAGVAAEVEDWSDGD